MCIRDRHFPLEYLCTHIAFCSADGQIDVIAVSYTHLASTPNNILEALDISIFFVFPVLFIQHCVRKPAWLQMCIRDSHRSYMFVLPALDPEKLRELSKQI